MTYPNETNSVGEFYQTDEGREVLTEAHENRMTWQDSRLIRFDRFRMLTDRDCPFWDISYARGVFIDDDGQEKFCQLILPFHQLNKRTWWSEIKEAAKRDGVNIYRLGLWDSISKLW